MKVEADPCPSLVEKYKVISNTLNIFFAVSIVTCIKRMCTICHLNFLV